jgi:2,4-dienoyl-CoA reductase-like NADH-dependent reductase (Old Yellow Enzyme family)
MSNQPLFMPYRMGDLNLPNRIVMAPLTRMRAQSHDHGLASGVLRAACIGRTDHRRGHRD